MTIDINDRIAIYYASDDPDLAKALQEWGDYVKIETQADSLTPGTPPAEAATGEAAERSLWTDGERRAISGIVTRNDAVAMEGVSSGSYFFLFGPSRPVSSLVAAAAAARRPCGRADPAVRRQSFGQRFSIRSLRA